MTKTPKLELPKTYSPEPIAVVGLGAIMPDAHTIEEFWQNIITGRNSIKEVPKERWDPELFWSDDRDAPDKTYSKIGAFVENFSLNPIEYRIPPNVLEQIDPVQQMALAAAKEALEDANYTADTFPSEKTAVIIGNSLGGEKSFEVSQRVYFPAIVHAMKQTENFKSLSKKEQDKLIAELEEVYKKDIPVINEDSMPGELANIVAGRIAATFNLRGKNMTSDAACASSLAAIDIAVKGLLAREYDAAVVGGSDRSMDPPTFVKFAKIGALSADGSFPFDERANGFVQGEGAGMMVLKRLSDALDANDKIYALVTGIGSSSDGKGKGITAPNPIGQELAVRRALEAANISAKDIQLLEAHGTSTSVGDFVEVSTIEQVYKEQGAEPQSIKLGSIKSQIGHLKSAAGAAGLLKAILAIHNKVYPPSINFETPNPKIDWASSPLQVNTHPVEWPNPKHTVRRAGVSSFGFGGTNFHVILEEYDPNENYPTGQVYYSSVVEEKGDSLTYDEYVTRNHDLELEPLLLSGSNADDVISQIEALSASTFASTYMEDQDKETLIEILAKLNYSSTDKFRLGVSTEDFKKLSPILSLAKGAIDDEKKREIARNRGVYVSEGLPEGKLAFVFPGQGSQYADMMQDLAEKYTVVEETFGEADEILKDMLDKPLSDYVFTKGRDYKEVNEGLRQTEITQPAMLTADIALFRLYQEYGIEPDMVAGHSLGEYAALVAAGILSFEDALKAVAIRGKAMSEVDAEDKGTMASITGSIEEVEKVLEEVEGYAIAANKNSLTSTVISGSTPGIEEAIEKFKAKDMNAIPLSVSAAFHTKIVEPAAEPLSEFLDEITFNKPEIPITSNVTGEFFPEDPEEIRDLMKQQVGASVEWTKQVQSMFEEGSTSFFEIGPKRALSSFVSDILSEENVLSVVCNHPKKGGIRTFNDSLAALAALGVELNIPDINSEIYHPMYRKSVVSEKKAAPVRSRQDDRSTSSQTSPQQQFTSSDMRYDQYQDFMDKMMEFSRSDAAKSAQLGYNFDNIVITGAGVGLPGKHKEVFSPDNVDRILRGDNLIENLPREKLEEQLEKNIRRLIKKSSGEAEFYSPKSYDDVIRLAGQQGKFDLVEEFGVKPEFASTYDLATGLAIASGLEALKDAGIPLVREYKKTSTGSYLPGDYVLPKELQDGTGIIFASAFPGFDSFAKEITEFKEYQLKEENRKSLTELYGDISRRVTGEAKEFLLEKIDRELKELDKEVNDYTFNRKILLEVLSFGHAQFAQLIKARGPNTQVNAACASTTQALGMAQDWIRTGRAKRVIVISADNITSDNLFEWLGSGFLATGAASIKDKVEEAALPFDRRRGGMIIGMGAAGFMVEPQSEAQRRGVTPIVELVGTHYSNSAYHGTRLDTKHVSEELQDFMNKVESTHGVSRHQIAQSMMFMSHETYTPRRGGSAAAEIRSLRETFGNVANQINIANTKGFTGHPMGAGIEDAIAIKAVEKGKIPPIANFKEPDPDLGNLKLSTGGNNQVEYALRLAAGFGSQISFALYKRVGSGDRFGAGYDAWIESIGGKRSDLYHEGKTLRLKDTGSPGKLSKIETPSRRPKPVQSTPVSRSPSQPSRQPVSVSAGDKSDIVGKIQDVMAGMTGYPKEMLDPKLDIEADLGIDTVKMAESMGQLNETFGVEADQSMNIADYNTIDKIADYYANRLGSGQGSVPSSQPVRSQSTTTSSSDGADKSEIIGKIQDVMASMTGYPKDMLDPKLDIEADLGIDTVKMAESMGQLNDTFGVEPDQSVNIADYNTIEKMATYYSSRIGSASSGSSVTQSQPTNRSQPSKTKPTKQASGAFEKVVEIISEITGYPSVMIPDGSINLAQDLGIDDSTRSQLNEKIADEFGISASELTNTSTVKDIVDVVLGGQAPTKAQPVPTKSDPTPSSKPSAKSLTSGKANVSNEIRDKVYEIISDQTGYPAMMIEDTLNLKEDLGIDNLTKQTIVSDITENFSADVNELLKSLSVGDLLHALAGEELPEAEVDQDDSSETSSTSTVVTGPVSEEETLEAVIDIIAEKTGYPTEMLDPTLDLESELGIDTVKQAEIFGIAREKFGVPPIEGMLLSDYNTINKIAELLSTTAGQITQQTDTLTADDTSSSGDEGSTFRYVIRENKTEVESEFDGNLVIITSKDVGELQDEKTVKVHETISDIVLEDNTSLLLLDIEEDNIGSTVELFKFLKENLDQLENLVLASKPDTYEEATIHHLTPVQGAVGGMFKALAMEFEHISGKIVIYEEIEQLNNELGTSGVEIIYRDGDRYEVALSPENLPETDYHLPENAVLLASGGAQGITFELVKSIIRSDSTVILLGRTEIRDDAEEISAMSDKEQEKAKFALMDKLKEGGETVTPVMLEKHWSKRIKSANVFESLKELRDLGCDVHYYSVDVTNSDDIEDMFDKLYDELDDKQITHFIHGAGVEISRATKSKSLEEFQLVYDVKTKGFDYLLEGLRQDKLELIVGFSSVAGRFGNATQVDYSAANEYLTRRCAQLNREGIRSLVIDWSAWAEIGMATRGSTMKVLESQGVTAIPVDAGIQRFKSELQIGEEMEVVISGKLGALASRVNWYDPDFFRGIMMDEFSGLDLRSSRMLSLEKDRYLDDHRIDGKAVLPGVMGLETMSEVSRAIQNATVNVIYDITFSSPVKLPRDEDLEIITIAQRMGNNLELDLKSKFIGPDGKQLGDLRQHFNATMVTGKRMIGFPVMGKGRVQEYTSQTVLDQESIYETFFHGPSYQVIKQLNTLYPDAVVATFNQPEKSMFEDDVDLEINPLMIEAAFQAAGLHMLYVKKTMGLPSAVGAIHIFDTKGTPHLLRAFFKNETETHAVYNVEIINEEGTCMGLLLDYSMIKTGTVETEDLDIQDQDDQIEVRSQIGQLDEDLILIDTDDLEEVTEEFLNAFLQHAELQRFSGLQAKKKRGEWLAGRIAAKLALAKTQQVALDSVEIEKDENRSPYAVILGIKTDVSITHSHGMAIAIAGETTVDLEKIEERHPSFLKEAFSEEEIDKYDLLNLDDQSVTKYWTMKEAHLKRMRIGLKTNLHGVKIEENGKDTSIVSSPQGTSFCQSRTTDKFVVTVAKPEEEAKITSLFS